MIHKRHGDTSALWSMCWMNFWCSLYNCIYLFVATTAGWDLLAFCRAFPEVQSSLGPATLHFKTLLLVLVSVIGAGTAGMLHLLGETCWGVSAGWVVCGAVLPVWRYWAIVHLRHNQEVWVAGQHAHLHHTEILQYSFECALEWQPPAASAVACCLSGLCWAAHILHCKEWQEEGGCRS